MILKTTLIFLSISICLVFGKQASGQDKKELEDCKCDFSNYKPLIISHPLVNAAIKKVEPDYPDMASAVRAQGKVEVSIIVNKQGNVVDACVITGHPLLKESARKAALQWKFKKNFGFTERQKKKYIQTSLFFNFTLKN